VEGTIADVPSLGNPVALELATTSQPVLSGDDRALPIPGTRRKRQPERCDFKRRAHTRHMNEILDRDRRDAETALVSAKPIEKRLGMRGCNRLLREFHDLKGHNSELMNIDIFSNHIFLYG
jgi:hypothetical protein